METILKELMEFFRKKIPGYFLDILALASGPKAFLRQEAGEQCDLGKAFTFLVLSLVLVNCLLLPIAPPAFLTASNGIAAVSYTVVFLALHLIVVLFSWKIAGCSPPISRIVVVYCYVSSIAGFLQGFWIWSNLLIFRIYSKVAPLLFEVENASEEQLLQMYTDHPELIEVGLWVIVLFCAYIIADLIWWLLIWGAFRYVAATGRLRSSIAFAVSFFLGWLLFGFSFIFISVLTPNQ